MAQGSQLTQLKSALSEAGLSRKSHPKFSGKKRNRSSSSISHVHDKNKAAKRLHEIHERLNPFDVKVTKLKHDIGGRKLKGVLGRPGLSKQAGVEQRKKSLLVEYELRNRAGGVVDRRFGENDPSIPPEERMLERFTRERQRSSKGAVFNLEDEDQLTHYGRSLSAMDDFDGVALSDDDEEEDNGQIDSKTVSKSHFGGFDEEESDSGASKKKSKAEIMSEIIAKSKEHKYQRQLEKEEVQNARHQLDQEFDSIREFLVSQPSSVATGSNAVPFGRPEPIPAVGSQSGDPGDQEYDQFVRELAFDKRSKPKDRTKTEEELALEEKEALEKAERARVRRMMGIEDESDVDGSEDGKHRKRKRGGDDLDDDFEGVEFDGLGPGLGDGTARYTDAEDGHSRSEGSAVDVEVQSEDIEGQESDHRRMRPGKVKRLSQTELPFAFPCPETHDEFLSIVRNVDDQDVPTVVNRIRTLHHPSLSEDNPAKLQALTCVLIDYILHITSSPSPRYSLLERLLPQIYALIRANPVVAADAFISKLILMHKNLMRGLSNGATSLHSKTWPGLAELSILRVIGVVWSTSDLNHAVVSPARVLIGAYLGLCRIRSTADIASGLFLCTVSLQFEELSKRFAPETVNFLLNSVLHLAPHSFTNTELTPGSFPVPDFGNDIFTSLNLRGKKLQTLEVSRPNLVTILCGQDTIESRVNLLDTAFQLLGRSAGMYKSLDGFIELFSPLLRILEGISLDQLPSSLQQRQRNLQGTLLNILKFSVQSRHPLHLQAHKPIPIPSYVPKFGSTSSNYLRRQDPDHERAMVSKLRYQVKQERKGAIRELRKDSRFLAGVQQERQAEKDKGYNERMKKVFSSMEGERAEQKALDREKAKEKKRAGRK